MAAANITITSQPSAAARVFALPELLEQILLDLACHVPLKYGVALEPVATISRCKSVSRTFYATISQSTKLQQRMQHAGIEGVNPNTSLNNGMTWLFEKKLNIALIRSFYWLKASSDFELSQGADRPMNRFPRLLAIERTEKLVAFQQRYGAPEATWLQVKCLGRGGIEFKYKVAKFLADGEDDVSVERIGGAAIVFRPEDTLGMVFDDFWAVIDRAK